MSKLKSRATGYLGADAVVRSTKSDVKAITFTVAVTESYKNKEGVKQENTTWLNCSLFKRKDQSTEIAKYLTKGSLISIEGKEDPKIYETKDGKQAISRDFIIDNSSNGLDLLVSTLDNKTD